MTAQNGRREAVALALASGRTVRDAAHETGVGERTVHTWLTDESFCALVTATRADLFTLAVGKLADLAGLAADALKGLLTSQSESIRLQAARAVLEYGPRFRESVEFDERLRALEALNTRGRT
jgi:hypothetical protein